MCVCSTPLSLNVMYLFGSFCGYDLSDRKKSSISAKKTIDHCREKGPRFTRCKPLEKKNRPIFFKKLYRRFEVVFLPTFFLRVKKAKNALCFCFFVASWLSNIKITGL